MAFMKSMSKPTIFLEASTISMGGQVASVATVTDRAAACSGAAVAMVRAARAISVRARRIDFMVPPLVRGDEIGQINFSEA